MIPSGSTKSFLVKASAAVTSSAITELASQLSRPVVVVRALTVRSILPIFIGLIVNLNVFEELPHTQSVVYVFETEMKSVVFLSETVT